MPTPFDTNDDLISSPSKQDEAANVDRLVFPLNVHESLKSSGGLKKGEKTGIAISFWLFGCSVLGWFLLSWLQSVLPDYYIIVTILVEVLLQLTVGVYLLRFVLDERALFQEVEKKDTSFAQYFKIYKEIISEDGSKLPFDVIEFNDGSWGAYLQLRLGFNTNARSDNTYHANHRLVEILNKAGLPRKTFYHNETFKTSQAADDLRNILSSIKDPKLFESYRAVVQNYLNIAEDESNVLCVTHLIYAQTRVQKDEFVATMTSIVAALTRFETVYREIQVLQYDEIVSFLQSYYKLAVLDMGQVRAGAAMAKKEFSANACHVLKLYGASGKIYANKEFKQLSSEIMKQSGLDSLS